MLGGSDYAIIGIYFIVTIALGLHFARRWKGSEVFFLAMIVLTKPSVALYSGTRVLTDLTGGNFHVIMWGIGIITAIYTMAGGLAAVVYTDALQAIILIGGSVLLTGFALFAVGCWS